MGKTKSQEDLILAEKCVSEVDGKEAGVKKTYGGLCHNFPVMMMTCGLCQAVAFSLSKAKDNKSEREQAHTLLLEHVAKLIDAKKETLLETIRSADTMTYLLYTRRVLSAWVYFKRFAVSILKVDAADADREAGDES